MSLTTVGTLKYSCTASLSFIFLLIHVIEGNPPPLIFLRMYYWHFLPEGFNLYVRCFHCCSIFQCLWRFLSLTVPSPP